MSIGGGEEERVGAGGYGGDGGGGEDGGVGVGGGDLGCFEEIEGFPLEGLVGRGGRGRGLVELE